MTADRRLPAAFLPDAGITGGLQDQSARAHARTLRALLEPIRRSQLFPAHEPALDHALAWLASGWSPRQREWMLNPCLRAWMAKVADALATPDVLDALRHLLRQLPNVSADPRAGRPFDLTFAVSDGLVPGLDLATRALVSGGVTEVRLRSSGRGDLSGPGVECLPADSAGPTRIPVRNDLPCVRMRVRTDRVPDRSDSIAGDGAEPDDPLYPGVGAQPFDRAMAWLAAVWPEELADWRLTLKLIVPYRPPEGWESDGFTLSSIQGAVWIHAASPLRTFESLVHEQSHVKLRFIEESVPLLAPEQEEATFTVGWRSDPRPLVGIFEGVYVHLHILHALARLLAGEVLDPGLREAARQRFTLLLDEVSQGLKLLRENARFTQPGLCFLPWATAELAAIREVSSRLASPPKRDRRSAAA